MNLLKERILAGSITFAIGVVVGTLAIGFASATFGNCYTHWHGWFPHIHCEEQQPNPTPTPMPSVEPSYTPEPTYEPEPSLEPSPEATPSATLCERIDGHDCGWSPPLYTPPEYKPAVCTVALPSPVTPKYESISDSSVKLTWEADDTNTTAWSLSYGYDKDNLPYGVLNLPKEAREYTVNGLNPNSVKWFELGRWNGDQCVVYGQRIDP